MRALGIIVVLIAVAFGGAYLMGWINVSANRDDASLNVKVNRDKVKEDAAKAREAVQNAGQKISQAAADGTVRGKLVSVTGNEVAIAVDGKDTMTVTTTAGKTMTVTTMTGKTTVGSDLKNAVDTVMG